MPGRKSATTKYRKRRQRELQNKLDRERRLRVFEYERAERRRKDEKNRRAKQLADPRRPEVQKLVNVLNARLWSNPLYKWRQMLRAVIRFSNWNIFWNILTLNLQRFFAPGKYARIYASLASNLSNISSAFLPSFLSI